ncbi:thioredoxin-like protein [Lasiosphaeria hispida]|uniref:Thioredoxin-like protein n=1 Tax=Lasiosphaeria hispida TaxID=260671 RepID=A0AAJ0H848_9PEZI|nr:thioredoxin-like protein [Lasiosphaeria hispida]
MGSQDAKLILYTNHGCPWAHRAHIALAEIGVPFEEVTIDLSVPRTPEYLAINPRGLVPALSYNGEIIIESAIVANFLSNRFPSHLLPTSNSEGGALQRARVDIFVDAFISKFQSPLFKLFAAKTEEETTPIVESAVAAVVKEIEPLLASAAPYFGGSDKLTQAEVLTGSFAIRLLSNTKHGIYPASLLESLKTQAPNFAKWAEVVAAHPSVSAIYDESVVIPNTKARIAKIRGD